MPDYKLPEGVETFPARICECGAVHDRPEAGCPECGSVIAREAGDAVFLSDLPVILSQERERVRQALEGLDRFVVGTRSSGGHYQERAVGQMIPMNEQNARGKAGQWIKRAEALAALDSMEER